MLLSWNSMGGKFPPWPTSNHCDCIIFTPHACCPFAITRLGNSSTRSRSPPYLAKFDLLSCPAGVWQVFTNCLGSVPFAYVQLIKQGHLLSCLGQLRYFPSIHIYYVSRWSCNVPSENYRAFCSVLYLSWLQPG